MKKSEAKQNSLSLSNLSSAEVDQLAEALTPYFERRLAQMTLVETQSHHEGPLPSPDVLLKYNEAIPGLGREIVDMAKKEQKARHWSVWLVHIFRFCGLAAGFVLAAGFLALGGYLVTQDKSAQGIAVLATGVATIIGSLFVRNKSKAPPSTPPPQKDAE